MKAGRLSRSELLWGLSVAFVLADSSIVTLALPEILREYDTSVFGVSWVLTAYNIVLAGAILAAAARARRQPLLTWSVGVGVFATASLLAAISATVEILIIARCIQALGGAMAVAGAIELLSRTRGSHPAAVTVWGAAGTAGLALGPAIGGLLTELLSWEAIFLLQVPLAAAIPFARTESPDMDPGSGGRPDLRPELALGLISAGLSAALFLLVVLLVEGWGLTPIGAAATVSVIPATTLLASRLRVPDGGADRFATAGAITIAGGLAALGLIPGASPALAIPPQILIGIGLALALPVLTDAAVGGADPDGSRAAGTIAARHLGIVIGILALTPILSSQLEDQYEAGRDAGTALLLDANLPPQTKLEIAGSIGGTIDAAAGELPDIREAFDGIDVGDEQRPALGELEAALDDQIERAATHAFTWPFLGAALFAALALLPIAGIGRAQRAASAAAATEVQAR